MPQIFIVTLKKDSIAFINDGCISKQINYDLRSKYHKYL